MVLVYDAVFIAFGVFSLLTVLAGGANSIPKRFGTPGKPYVERRGENGRVEYVSARIKKADLDTGTSTNSRIRAYVKHMGGLKGDDAGHLIANRLGGSGTDSFNIVPQNANCNRGMWKNTVESRVYDCVNGGNEATFEVWPKYKGNENRPYQLKYTWICIVRGKYDRHRGIVPNPKPPKKCVTEKKKNKKSKRGKKN